MGVLYRNGADRQTDRERERERERERCLCACCTETEQRERERERERERGVRACWESKTSRSPDSTGDSLRLNKVWALFFRQKKSLKGSAMLLSWQHSASPFLQLRVGTAVKPAALVFLLCM